MKRSDPPIVIEVTYPISEVRLWNALTLLPEMKKWYFEMLPDFRARVGFRTSFQVQSESRTFTHQWEVLEVIPGNRIAYRWTFAEYPGASISIFEVSGDEHRASLKLTIEVESDFPDDIPEFTRKSCIEGWDFFLRGNLRNYLTA